ncbi:hypothetical protein DYH09_35080 [bacterium CPR1]|nr:hypothetical protein [bacterium CPR1]
MTTTCAVAMALDILRRWAYLQALILAGDQRAYLARGPVTAQGLAELARRAESLSRLLPPTEDD